jgi:sugar phosphate isomerase/epimerase
MNNINKIGISSKNLKVSLRKSITDLDGFFNIELNRRITFFPFSAKTKDFFTKNSGFLYSIHSDIARLTDEGEFAKINYDILHNEIILCSMFNIKHLIFHAKHSKKTNELIRKLSEFAKTKNVQLCLENNILSSIDELEDAFNTNPDLKMNLDIGHLNVLLHKKSNITIEDYLKKLKDKIIYLHIHDNDGKSDEHLALSDGNVDYRKIFSLLDFNKVERIVVETDKMENAIKTKEILIEYFKK